ncbi:hypothetical protein N7456_008018 [Penicillium angulare]|uniref:Uncharacterized protein n=1 Tax=Penicillium angulare TaxID=116970 RepID=A0A9W9FC93_9EURO|nr:hypothetical protein N7456_008018 [Penicillium angulare]
MFLPPVVAANHLVAGCDHQSESVNVNKEHGQVKLTGTCQAPGVKKKAKKRSNQRKRSRRKKNRRLQLSHLKIPQMIVLLGEGVGVGEEVQARLEGGAPVEGEARAEGEEEVPVGEGVAADGEALVDAEIVVDEEAETSHKFRHICNNNNHVRLVGMPKYHVGMHIYITLEA